MPDLIKLTRLSYLYHKKREGFFSFLDKTTKLFSLLAVTSLGLGGFSDLVGKIIALISILLTILSICFNFSENTVLHKNLANRFSALRKKLYMEEEMSKLTLEYYSIQENEPPALTGLIQLCQDEIEYSDGEQVPEHRLSLCRKFRAYFGFGSYPKM